MIEEEIRVNSVKAWLLASRPKTLAAAAVPVMVGLSIAWSEMPAGRSFAVVPALLCVLFAFVMQIDANFVNDYFDFARGNDDETRLGPKRACAQGWITPGTMRMGMAVTTCVACVIGLPLVMWGGWTMILVGMACVAFCFLYTTTLSYLGLGDVLVVVFFGLVPVSLTYYLQTGCFTSVAIIASLTCGIVTDALLLVNNYRDIENDRRAGKITLVVRVGAKGGRTLYLLTGITAVIVGAFFALKGHPYATLLTLAYVPLHVSTYREMVRISKGKALNKVLGKTARNIFLYGLLLSCGFLLK